MNTILHISKTHTGTWIVFTSSAVFGKRTVLHTHWPTIDFDVIMLDTHAVSIKIPRVQHEFYEDQSQTIETFRQALQMDQERIFYKSMIETSRIIRRTAISEETFTKIHVYVNLQQETNSSTLWTCLAKMAWFLRRRLCIMETAAFLEDDGVLTGIVRSNGKDCNVHRNRSRRALSQHSTSPAPAHDAGLQKIVAVSSIHISTS
ncbi:hypothetical protein B9Z55_023421 [Caenorhabditis nigoni]|uniref:Uncharacterized protein n=1 Tax=Caenorhabditis nigoni TaxID=1611254 RepID=A0A2G5SPZ3_9PELO|nr:hypothetical protein B9Z55_023421 [Caenorhabditis nigoni]